MAMEAENIFVAML